ncbi:pirin-like C-terminal cupin domain-containing protein [Flagellimonas lutaonensis]|uniref:Pirin C-terminal domain-containing protein n=1 Tax=Flagellimonas lutaonensis TaxID=516051 RepID=A0A0D5YVK4_9FLAO|nr:pirin-like C-terminal cupin domain-containing protein [Allomuricauda lutaonensis]AKA36347.1 hypothetical protein VC82_2795 [Allomuricauda lutaonensis]
MSNIGMIIEERSRDIGDFLVGRLIPFAEERHIFWNFVSSSKKKIEHAKKAWQNKTFSMMKGGDTYVPLP